MDNPNILDILTEQLVEQAAGLESETLEEAVHRLANLHPLEYERCREDEARRLKVRVSVLDKEVLKSQGIRQEGGGRELLFPTVEPWPEPIDPVQLLDEMNATIRQFIACDMSTSIAASLWCAFTWLTDVVDIAPLAVISAPEKRCGKTQLLILIGRLSCRPLFVSNIGPAAVFRVVDAHSPTLLIDEADTFLKDNDELRGVINSGHTKDSAFVVRCVGDDHDTKQFGTWGPKALAGIGHLPETVMDRAVILGLRRKLPSEHVSRIRHAEPGLFGRLASRLARFAKDAAPSISAAKPSLPEQLNDRAQDNWEPLLAIADYAGGHWPKTARDAALKISGDSDNAGTRGSELLADIREAFESRNIIKLSTANLIDALCADEEKSWATWNRGKPITPKQLSRMLHDYGIRSKTVRIGPETVKGFEVEQFHEAFARYLLPLPENCGDRSQPSNHRSPCVADGVTGNSCCGNGNGNVTGGADCNRNTTTSETLESAPALECDGVTGNSVGNDEV